MNLPSNHKKSISRISVFLVSIWCLAACGQSVGQGIEHKNLTGMSNAGVLLFQSEDSCFAWWLDARIYLDAAFYQEDKNDLSNGTELRKSRFAIKSTLWRDWGAEIDIDFADNEIDVKDAWVSYNNIFNLSNFVKVGNFKEPFSLEELTSSKHITFMERALPNVFTPGRNLGIAYSMWGDKWQITSGIFGQKLDDLDANEDEGFGISGRLTANPINDTNKLIHLGIGALYRTPEANNPNEVRFHTRPESHVDRERYLNTGKIDNATSYNCIGVEAASIFRQFSIQGEYISTRVQRKNNEPRLSFWGGYIYGSWFVFGGKRTYLVNSGEFEREVSHNKPGALELALRYSTLDLSDDNVTGGITTQYTAGLNWYFNPNVRLMINYIIVNNDINADAHSSIVGDDDFNIFQLRYQVTF